MIQSNNVNVHYDLFIIKDIIFSFKIYLLVHSIVNVHLATHNRSVYGISFYREFVGSFPEKYVTVSLLNEVKLTT